MHYNTTEERLRMPEYGRLVQQMAEHAVSIADRSKRQAYAKEIIRIMAHLNPKMRGVADYQHKLWDHLAYIADYKLDIDYPVEIHRRDTEQRPPRLSYPQGNIRYHHYGRLLEMAIQKAADMPDGPARKRLTGLIVSRMKRNLTSWRGPSAADAKVARDLESYTDGKIRL